MGFVVGGGFVGLAVDGDFVGLDDGCPVGDATHGPTSSQTSCHEVFSLFGLKSGWLQ